MTLITQQEYQDAVAFLDAWFAEDETRTLDDIRPYTPAGDAYYRFTTFQEGQGEEGHQPEEFFQINSEGRLAWYVGKMADAESKIKRIEAQAAEMVAQIRADMRGLEFRFGAQAESFLRGQLTGKRRSVKTLHGTIGLRKIPTQLKVMDKAALIASIRSDYPELHDLIHDDVDSAELKRRVTFSDDGLFLGNGEKVTALDGLELVPSREKVYVKAGEE